VIPEVFRLDSRVTLLPVLHGSGDVALEVRRFLLEHRFDCVAVPIPSSFREGVEDAIRELPAVSLVTQPDRATWSLPAWQPDTPDGDAEEDDALPERSFVPIDPCQPVIAALRFAVMERIPRAYLDQETRRFVPCSASLPDPYALKRVPLAKFAAAVLPAIPRPPEGQPRDRVAVMADRLRRLRRRHRSVLGLCSVLDWPWIREAFAQGHDAPADEEVEPTETLAPDARTLLFVLGELPFITGLYERARRELEEDENLSVDGVKELLLAARHRYRRKLGDEARHLSPKTLALYLRYVRNLCLIERRLTPDLYTLTIAAQQVGGSRFAVHVAETARHYPYSRELPHRGITLGVGRGRLDAGETCRLVSRLPGPPLEWRSLDLRREPERSEQRRWLRAWNPFHTVSWLPEDERIERFRTHCIDRAREILTADLARSEKFTTSLLDGVDVRETLRNWHTGDLWVKSFPPRIGGLDCVVMLFDVPADPRRYPLRMTWQAEHADESTLVLFGTDFLSRIVGPGIGRSLYGGAMFLYPPLPIPEVWHDPRFDFATTLEERLLAAACYYSRQRHIALLSPVAPGAGWRRLARRFRRRWVHLPLSKFSQSTVENLRVFHVLNGRHVRSYAARFIQRDG